MSKTFADIVELSRYLRGPDGCPWDKEQTILTLRKFILEEAYELIEAIESGGNEEIIEELGDFLFQVVFASEIASEEGRFTVEDVIDNLHNKLVRRHPHVFGEKKAENSAQAVKSWQSEKLKEKNVEKRFLD
ncbi:MAG: MazG nucleotide pyrophosphohydrolase domain-containing protein, partial [Thermodesulfobacteriota bacterium]